mmetsp:Transcript_24415/g.62061  ORF Transcript_24415/g.62061 Transcript_24415/m.62061 type:complete len:715 (-) Transcript_24415:112-2256(-)|eukprot:CAMPEP_0202885184 /NCGR_PEP_ID=MMETSP1391-20130828/41534_1 /ASSEMBLY_ACC=CAM_ASM_000867 /TAXON_ID=1034604 /ORGANISM="Chlamydomonas leiostraca, Strain SAG 11-49" /LENGTH=714 /DNA_ID=CAMNT_0049568427 /DNA_START=78 /DNA_END=2222 /DNA_ORIENTATION=-
MASSFLDEHDGQDTTAYYAILNVSKDATPDEITKSYRRLAQVFHPDKHINEENRKHAQESFSKVQEAYEVLSDSYKREVYDVYGKQGLAAGLEVGDHLKSREEIRKEWEEFKAKLERQKQEQAVVQRGSYQCRVDASRLLRGEGLGKGPLFRSVVAQSALEAVVGERNVMSVSGQAAVRPAYRKTPQGVEEVTLGGGNVVFGYKRIISDDDSLDLSAQVGLASLLSLTTTRRLHRGCQRDGWLHTSWGPQSGWGMQVGCSQALFHGMQGSVAAVLGPSGATGVSTTLSKRGTKYSVQGKLEVGAVHSIQLRANYAAGGSVTLRAIGRLGTTGIDLELGAAKRWSPQITSYVGTAVGYPTGVVLKLRVVRAGQAFECPVLLTSDYTDWRIIAGAYVLPPLLYVAGMRLVVRPLANWARNRKEAAQRAQAFETTHQALAKAAAERALIAAVARRKAVSESRDKGLIILEACYGVVDEYRSWQAQQLKHKGPQGVSAGSAGASTNGSVGSSSGAAPNGTAAENGRQANGDAAPGASTSGAPQAPSQQDGASSTSSSSSQELPPPWLRVTSALQYLVTDSRLVLARGVPKSGLMGFTDPAPHMSCDKALYVAFSYKGHVYEAVVGEKDELVLPPGAGNHAAGGSTGAAGGGAGSTQFDEDDVSASSSLPPRTPRGGARPTPVVPVADAELLALLHALHQQHVIQGDQPTQQAAQPQQA